MGGRPTVNEVSAPYANFMRNAAPRGPSVCRVCHTFTDGYATCFPCARQPSLLDAVAPITYASARGQMHLALRDYKDGRTQGVRDQFSRGLLAVLWRFLRDHEPCVARAAGVERFDVVTSVPSKTGPRDDERPRLRTIVGTHCEPTRERYERVIRPKNGGHGKRGFDQDRYETMRRLEGSAVLLIDDTWVTGAAAQSSAHALRHAGARAVALVVIGRYVNPDFSDHGPRLDSLPSAFDWARCPVAPP